MEKASSAKSKTKIVELALEPRVKKLVIVLFALLLLVGAGTTIGLVNRAQNRAQKTSVQKKAKTTLKGGVDYYEKGKFDKAIPSLEETVKLDPDNTKARLLLAQSHEATGEIDKAETEYKKYIDLDDSNPEAHYNLAIVYKSQGKTKEATSELEKAVKLRKEFVAARLILADLYTQQGDKDKAIEQYETVIKTKPFGTDLAEVQKKLDGLK